MNFWYNKLKNLNKGGLKMSENNGFIGAKVPIELEQKFREKSEKEGINRSFVIRKLVEEWLRKQEKAVK